MLLRISPTTLLRVQPFNARHCGHMFSTKRRSLRKWASWTAWRPLWSSASAPWAAGLVSSSILDPKARRCKKEKREQKQSEIWWWSLVPPVQYCQLQCCSCPCPSGEALTWSLCSRMPGDSQPSFCRIPKRRFARWGVSPALGTRNDGIAGMQVFDGILIVDCAALQQAWSYKPCSIFCTEGSRLCCRSLLVFPKHSKLAFSSSFPRFGWRGNLQENPWKPCIYNIYSPVKTVVSCRFSQNQPIEKIGSRIGRWFCQDGEEEEELDRFERAMRSYERHTSLISDSSYIYIYIYVNMISHLFIGAQNVFGLPGCWNCPSAVDVTGTWRSD